MSFPRYPEYKDSGVELLGDVPEHWCVPQIKRTTYLKARVGWKGLTSDEFREQSFAYLVTGSDFREKFVKWDECYQVEQDRYEDDPFIQLQNGDLLITKDGTIGKLAIVSDLDRPACLNSGIFVVRPRNSYTTAFMYWILSSKVFSAFCDLESFGSTINHLYQNVFERFAFPAPPESEQTRIAAFLDRETAKIDALVAEQRRLVELLKEKRQAVISHAVTQGLNPNAPMKPSGIEWLGDVPAHWEVKRYKNALRIFQGMAFKSSDYVDYSATLSVRMGNIKKGGSIDLEHNTKHLPDGFAETFKEYALKENDLIIAMTDMSPSLEFLAVPAIMKDLDPGQTYLLNQRVGKLVVSENFNSEFIKYLLLSDGLRDQLKFLGLGTVQSNMSSEDLYCAFFVAPSLNEQTTIVTFLDNESLNLNTLITEAQRAIDLLQERRTALISAAVTGQIDVRQLSQTQKVGAGGTAIRSGESSAA